MKTLSEKKVNRKIKKFNRVLKADVFNGRFYVREMQKSRYAGMTYFLYIVCDDEHPENNKVVGWCNEFSLGKIWEEMNILIIESDFWEKWRNKNI